MAKNNWLTFAIRAVASFSLLFFASQTWAATNSGITYQGRILKPDGSALQGTAVQFKMQIRTPGSQNCLMFEEIHTLDLRNSNGIFSLTMNDGNGARTDSTALGLDRIFANRGSFTFDPMTCSLGSTYAPNPDDGRKLAVFFKDETMSTWEPIPAQQINFVPLAIESMQVQGFTPSSLVRVQEADGTMGNVSPLSNANYNELLALVNGTTAQYEKPGRLAGVSLPSMTTGEVLGWNGSAWVSQPAVAGANSVTTTMIQNNAVDSTKIASGAVGSTQIASNVTINTSGTIGAAVTTTRDFKIFAASPSTFSIDMQAPALASSYSLVWPLNDGGAGEVLTTDGSGLLSWAPASAPSQWTTHGTDISYDGGGKVGIGTTSPAAALDVSLNAGSFDSLPSATVAHFSNADGSNSRVLIDAAGPGVYPSVSFRTSRGTAAAPTATQSGDILGQLSFIGRGATGFPGSQPLIIAKAGENWTDTAQGSYLRFQTIDLGTTNYVERLRIAPSGYVGIGTTAPQATLDVNGAIRVGSSALTCSVTTTGAIRLNGSILELCVSSSWTPLSYSGSSFVMTNGSASSPGLSISGDANTGVFSPAADTISLTAGGTEGLRVNAVTSAVNYASITPSITGSPVSISAAGSDANTSLQMNANGTGSVRLATGGGLQVSVNDTASAVNYVTLTGAPAASSPTVAVAGADTNIDLMVAGKGSGGVVAKGASIRSVASTGSSLSNATTSIDWSKGNNQLMTVDCTATTFTNMQDGATYNLALMELGTTTCVFAQAGLTFYYSPGNGARINGQPTLYSFTRIGNNVFTSWTTMAP